MNWRDKIPEMIIGSVIIAGGGWLISQTYGINRAVGTLEAKFDAKLSENTGRIDRIAAVLPDVRIRIAKEELGKPLVTAVVVLDPKKTVNGKWVTGVHVIDTAAMTRNTYLVSVKGPEDKEVAWLASGAAYEADSEALSFKTLSTFSSDVGTPTQYPAYVRAQNSFVLRKPTLEFPGFSGGGKIAYPHLMGGTSWKPNEIAVMSALPTNSSRRTRSNTALRPCAAYWKLRPVAITLG